MLKSRQIKIFRLGKKLPGFSGITGFGRGFFPGISGYIVSHAFMDSHIFKGQVIIILDIRIKIFHFPAVHGKGNEDLFVVSLNGKKRAFQVKGNRK